MLLIWKKKIPKITQRFPVQIRINKYRDYEKILLNNTLTGIDLGVKIYAKLLFYNFNPKVSRPKDLQIMLTIGESFQHYWLVGHIQFLSGLLFST